MRKTLIVTAVLAGVGLMTAAQASEDRARPAPDSSHEMTEHSRPGSERVSASRHHRWHESRERHHERKEAREHEHGHDDDRD
ncbi:MAG: hypothetical protein HY852_00860 [Bradyrhizobium sp.]|uniref:hypothetical protein n=1 Tax=Bradyrhizobium sp. TaxID=376 RepID=UPI0025B858D1|nr:hypothetical protein [Bradyrhizobium sp.]MBI5260350.1 hypothetical protein [Bradyrhizobium sp.]